MIRTSRHDPDCAQLQKRGFPARITRMSGMSVLALFVAVAGCQVRYGASVANATSDPIFVQIFSREGESEVLAASRRIPAGQSGLVGPVDAATKDGLRLSVAHGANPLKPYSIIIPPGSHSVRVAEIENDATGLSVQIEKLP